MAAQRTDTQRRISAGGHEYPIYRYSAEIPATALEPQMMLSIVNDTTSDTDDDWVWATSATGNGQLRGRSGEGVAWAFYNGSVAFRIYDAETPDFALLEPLVSSLVPTAEQIDSVIESIIAQVQSLSLP